MGTLYFQTIQISQNQLTCTLEAAENSTICTLEISGESSKEAGLKPRGIFNKLKSGFGICGDCVFSNWVVFNCGIDPPVLAYKRSTKLPLKAPFVILTGSS